MEDTGTLLALTYLHKTGKVNKDRVLVLRTGSNYSMPPPGVTAAANMQKENAGYSALIPSVEAAYKVGSTVVTELLDKWPTYRDHPPSASAKAP
jgi:purine nucleoside permease